MINIKDFISEQILFSKTFASFNKKEISIYITDNKIYTVEYKPEENKYSNYIFNKNAISTMILFETSSLGNHYCIQFNIDGKSHSFDFPYTPDGEAAADEVFAALAKY